MGHAPIHLPRNGCYQPLSSFLAYCNIILMSLFFKNCKFIEVHLKEKMLCFAHIFFLTK